jgi:hypothetical protein
MVYTQHNNNTKIHFLLARINEFKPPEDGSKKVKESTNT